jgi:hypothetical protein
MASIKERLRRRDVNSTLRHSRGIDDTHGVIPPSTIAATDAGVGAPVIELR